MPSWIHDFTIMLECLFGSGVDYFQSCMSCGRAVPSCFFIITQRLITGFWLMLILWTLFWAATFNWHKCPNCSYLGKIMCNVHLAPFLLFCLGTRPHTRANSSPEVVQGTLFFQIVLVSPRHIYTIKYWNVQSEHCLTSLWSCRHYAGLHLFVLRSSFVRHHGERNKASEVYKEVNK